MKNLFKALANFQQEVPVLHKATKGYGYTYTELSDIVKVINPLLKKNGLGFTQLVESKGIKTILFHGETGETLDSFTEIPQDINLKGMNDFQVLGAAITYIRRYALSSMLGLVTDKDIDASGEQVKARPRINDDRFNKAIEAIKTGKASVTDLFRFDLNAKQKETLNNLITKTDE